MIYIKDIEYCKYQFCGFGFKFHRIWQKAVSESFHPSYRINKISKGVIQAENNGCVILNYYKRLGEEISVLVKS